MVKEIDVADIRGRKSKTKVFTTRKEADDILDTLRGFKNKGKGWHGDTPGHRKAALKAERKGAINEPIRTQQKDIVYKNYNVMEFIKAIEQEEGLNLNSTQRTDLYNYAIDNRFADELEAYQFAIIIRLWAEGKWHPDWHPNNLKNIHDELPQEIKDIKAHMQRVKLKGEAKGTLLKGVEIYDNGGYTADRYTVVLPNGDVYTMSSNATSPQGVNMYAGTIGSGGFTWAITRYDIKVPINRVPTEVLTAIKNRMR